MRPPFLFQIGLSVLRRNEAWYWAENPSECFDQKTRIVTADLSFTSKWLAPRLFSFAQAHPDIELRFSQADHAVDAALTGGRAILGKLSLTETYLRDGRLVMPLNWALVQCELSCRLSERSRNTSADNPIH